MTSKLSFSLAIALLSTFALVAFGEQKSPPKKVEKTGRWRKVSQVDEEQRRKIEELEAIGYLTGSVETDRSGVTIYSRQQTFDGLNLYSSGHGPEAVLMDMDGTVLHRWRKSFEEVWPRAVGDRTKNGAKWWRRVYLYENGDLLVIFEGLGLIKINRDSELIWAQKNGAHHDFEVLPDGSIFVLTRTASLIDWVDEEEPTLEDFVTLLDKDGQELRSVSILDAFRGTEFEPFLFQGVTKVGDISHTNTLHVLDGRIAKSMPSFRRGNLLLSMNALGVVTVLDLQSESLVWARKTPPHGQHDPKILENGNMLIFNNERELGQSKVLELKLPGQTEVWQYQGSPKHPFYSRTCGAVQRLSNGNTLITESDSGRAFEVAPDQSIVWEFYTPHRAGENDEFIATLAEVIRLPPEFPTSWSSSASGG